MIDTVVAPPAEKRGESAPSGERLRSLDGLRAISIVLVLLSHLTLPWNRRRLDFGIGDYGRLGVIVFFVISGFLITSLLQSERDRSGRISLKLFYARRALRIFPAAYAFLACVLILCLAGFVNATSRDFAYAFTYTVNYQPNPSWSIGHLWSLSVEEQFYLLWPLAFVTLAPRRAAWVAVAVILLGPGARAAAWLFLLDTPYADRPMFPMIADSLAVGCLLAMSRGWLERQAWYLRLLRPESSVILIAIVLVLNRYSGYGAFEVLGKSVINVALALIVHRCVLHSRGPVGRLLNWTPVVFVGVLSYSIYLWQQLFLDRRSSAWWNQFPQNLIFTMAAALASYFLLERPLLALRHRLRAR